MKSVFKIALLFLFASSTTSGFAQDLIVSTTVGWRIGGKFGRSYFADDPTHKFDSSFGKNQNNLNISINTPAFDNAELEIFVDHQNSTLTSDRYFPQRSFNLFLNFYHAGLVLVSSQLGQDFYAGFTLGVTHMIPHEDFDSEFFFSFGPTAGLRYFLNNHLGVKAHSRLLLTSVRPQEGMFSKDGEPQFYYTSSFLIQMDLSIGIFFAFY